MPPRWLSVGIVAGWLATMGWLFWHDLWPNWRPGQAPRFHIDLVEEVRNSNRVKINWDVQRQQKDEPAPALLFQASSWTDYQQGDDTFTLHAVLKARREGVLELFGFRIDRLESEYTVDRSGHLKALQAEIHLLPKGEKRKMEKGDLQKKENASGEPLKLHLRGDVRGDRFVSCCSANLTKGVEIPLPPVPMPPSVSVLLPLHPVDRIHGLAPGQNWRQPLIDPLRDAFSALPLLGPQGGVHFLNARVLPQPQILQEAGEPERSCLVIEYEDEGQIVGRTWVELHSERVQQQQFVLDDGTWTMKRDNPRKAAKRGERPASAVR